MSNRYRLKFEFWLEPGKTDHDQVADTIELLKNERAFSGAVREGIMLVAELRQGRSDMLFRLYPWLTAELDARRGNSGNSGGGEDDVKASIQRLEQILLAQSTGPVMRSGAGPKALTVPAVAGPVIDDDDDIELDIRKAAPVGKSAQTFLDAAFSLQG